MTYEALHSYLIEGPRYWYELFLPSQEGGWADVDEADAPAEDAREGAVVRADTVPPPATFNMVFRSAAASAAPPASTAPPAEADAAPDAGAAREAGAEKLLSSILCPNSLDFLASNRQQQQQQQQQEKAAGPVGEQS